MSSDKKNQVRFHHFDKTIKKKMLKQGIFENLFFFYKNKYYVSKLILPLNSLAVFISGGLYPPREKFITIDWFNILLLFHHAFFECIPTVIVCINLINF